MPTDAERLADALDPYRRDADPALVAALDSSVPDVPTQSAYLANLGVAPTVQSTGGTVQVATPLGQALGDGMADAVMAPGRAFTGEMQVRDPQTGALTREATDWGAETALGMLGGSSIPRVAAGAGETVLGSGPIRAYHGSRVDFDGPMRPSERGALGPGVYFTPAENIAQRYKGEAGKVYEAEIGGDIFNGLGSRDSSVNPYQVWRDQTARLVEAAEPEMKARVAEIAGKMSPSDGYPFMSRIAQEYRDQGKAQDLFKRAGFDGVSGHADGPEIAVFNPAVIDVLRKYGVASVAALPPAVQASLGIGQQHNGAPQT